MTAKEYRDLGAKSGPSQLPMPKAKPNMSQPVRNVRGTEQAPTSKFPQRGKVLP